MPDDHGLIDLSDGWFPVWRKIDDSWVYQNPVVLKVWVECMRVAAHSHRWFDLRVGAGVIQVELQAGQCVFGRRAWGKKLKLEPKKVERIIIALVKHGNLGRKVTHHYSVLTLLQHGVYRLSKTESDPIVDPALTQPCPSLDPTLSTYKKVETLETVETDEKQQQSARADAPPAKQKRTAKFAEGDMDVATWMWGMVDDLGIGAKEPSLEVWANDVRLMRERDKRTDEEIRELFTWANDPGCWWSTRLLSPAKLREKWATLYGQMKQPSQGGRHDQPGPGQRYDPDAEQDENPIGGFR